jgi:hypothetical protein
MSRCVARRLGGFLFFGHKGENFFICLATLLKVNIKQRRIVLLKVKMPKKAKMQAEIQSFGEIQKNWKWIWWGTLLAANSSGTL